MAAPLGTILGTDEFSEENIQKKIGDKINDPTKKDTIIKNVIELKNTLKEDFDGYAEASDKLGKTIEFFKQKTNDGAEALYAMMDNMELKGKIQTELSTKGVPMSMISEAYQPFYKALPTGPLKLIGNIVGDAITKESVNGKDYRKKGDDDLYEIISLAKAVAAQGAEAALEAGKKEGTTKKPKEVPKTGFGKRKRGPSASLKRMCKKHGVRLTVKRGKKRVYKSSKVLKGECQKKLKNKLIKNKKKINFGKKKIKRSGIMPPRKRRRKKRSRLSSTARGVKRGVSAATRYVTRNPKKVGLAGLGLAGLGLGLGEGYARYKGYESPTGRAFRRVKGSATGAYDYFKNASRNQIQRDIMSLAKPIRDKVVSAVSTKQDPVRTFDKIVADFEKQEKLKKEQEQKKDTAFLTWGGYGKRRRRRRKRKSSFGKAKKPSAATRRMCKRLKVKMTLKRGGKRVYKSEAMLKKQCKKAMKKKSKR